MKYKDYHEKYKGDIIRCYRGYLTSHFGGKARKPEKIRAIIDAGREKERREIQQEHDYLQTT